jgi:hypothetical protein
MNATAFCVLPTLSVTRIVTPTARFQAGTPKPGRHPPARCTLDKLT